MMKKLLAVVAATLLWGLAIPHSAWSAAKVVTINGYVLDSACAFTKSLKKPISPECAVACAKAGSPLVVMSGDGTIYLPISDATPAQGQNSRLMKFAGKKVTVTGRVYDRNGAHGLVIEKIVAAGS
ncbi:MAG TPA: hypothetical protein VMX16_02190 [Terriglobia bacterium]|nr:hypothetical protein [Terriglobia bacterium]